MIDSYGDAEVVAVLRKHGFGGLAWDRYTEQLCRRGLCVLPPWILNKRIFAEMRRKKIRCCGPVVIDEQGARDLATDAIVNAISPFREMLTNEGWDPQGPATLAAAFINGCLQQFPNVYRSWLHKTFGHELERLEALPGNDGIARLIENRTRGDPLLADEPEAIVIAQLRRGELLALLPDDLRAVIQLVVQGYSFTRAATVLGEDPEKLRARLHRIRPRLLRLWQEHPGQLCGRYTCLTMTRQSARWS